MASQSLPAPHPEDAIIGQIDALIDAQMASRPGDDNTDYYPKCSCGHDWHGVKCAYCGCPGTYATDVELHKFHRPQRSPRRDINFRVDCGTEDFEPVWRANQNQDGTAYTIDTIVNINAWRWPRLNALRVPPNPLLPPRPRARFWATGADGDITEVEGTLDIDEYIQRHRGPTTLAGHLLQPILFRTWRPSDLDAGIPNELIDRGFQPSDTNAIALALHTPDGFHHLGYINPDDLDIEEHSEVAMWDGSQVTECQRSVMVRFALAIEQIHTTLQQLLWPPP